jgi:single-strand DNA-binding protein
MSYGLNKVMLIGHLGADPELKYTPAGIPVASFRIATNESYKDQEGNLVPRTEWHNIVAWRKSAELLNEYVRKGSKIYIEGRLQTRNWEDKDGAKRYMTEIVVDDFMFLDSKGNGGHGGAHDREEPPPPQSAAAKEPKEKEEDLPF